MKTVIYRKSDLTLVGQVNGTLEDTISLNVIPNFGGTADDYGSIETDKEKFHLETINNVVTVVEETATQPLYTPSNEERLAALEKAMNDLVMNSSSTSTTTTTGGN